MTVVPDSDKHRSRKWLLENRHFSERTSHRLSVAIRQELADSRYTQIDHSLSSTYVTSSINNQCTPPFIPTPPALGRSRRLAENARDFEQFFHFME